MGRYNTGAITVGDCLSLPISTFVKVIKDKSFGLSGVITWSNGASLGMILMDMGERYYLELDYIVTQHGEKYLLNTVYGLLANLLIWARVPCTFFFVLLKRSCPQVVDGICLQIL